MSFHLVILLLVATVLIVFSMIFSATESAFLSVSKLRLRILQKKHDKRAIRVLSLLEEKDKLINTLLVLNNITNIALSAIFSFISISLFGLPGVGIAAFSVTIFLLIFGEITPKTVATHHPEETALFFSGAISFLGKVFSPIVLFFTKLSDIALTLLHATPKAKTVSYTEEEIKTFLDVGAEEGVIPTREKEMMGQVFKFSDLIAREIMVPRKEIVAVPFGASYSDIIRLSQSTGFSRFPVYRKNIDDIVGIIYIKDLLPFKNKSLEFNISSTMRSPIFILATKNMSGVQERLWESRQSMAIVVDEYSGTYGLLTREDIIREIFGPTLGGKSGKHFAEKQNLEVEGSARLIDLNEWLDIHLFSETCDTIGGFISEKLGVIPTEKDSIFESGFRFTVTEAGDNLVKKVLIEKDESWEVRR